MRVLSYSLLASALAVVLTIPARAHDSQLSGIRILYQEDAVLVNVTTHLSQLAQAEHREVGSMTSAARDLAVRRRLKLRLDGKDFTPEKVNLIQDNANDLLIWQARSARPAARAEVLARIYPEAAPSRTVVTILKDGLTVQETLLDAAHPDLLLTPALHNRTVPVEAEATRSTSGVVSAGFPLGVGIGLFALLAASLALICGRGAARRQEARQEGV
ncbi:MAG TPA: hypothetical protein VKU00_03420 [Chthonomonadaceae bacterium]|nr:hypothetical protein [Chthonomonadaceae bacterium]